MIETLQQWLIAFGLWLAKLCGWTEPGPMPAPPPQIIVREVEKLVYVPSDSPLALDPPTPDPEFQPASALPTDPLVPSDVLTLARHVVKEIERQNFHTGEQKRHNALTAMLNHFPRQERDAGLAIELAVRGF